MTTIEKRIALLASIPHELCHYLVARLLGLPAKMRLYKTDVWHDHCDWRAVLIVLAPILAGYLLLIAVALLCYVKSNWLPIAPTLVWCACWQVLCARDYSCVWHMLRYREFLKDEQGFQGWAWLGLKRIQQ
jgi:hypothetical protein